MKSRFTSIPEEKSAFLAARSTKAAVLNLYNLAI